MLAELEQAWAELDADPDVRVIVNTGNGRAFQTGLDVAQLGRGQGRAARAVAPHPRRRAAAHRVAQPGVRKPVIAAVNGVCAGGGLHFVADADIVIAVERRHVPRPARVGRPGHRVRGDRARAEVADGADPAHGADRAPRAHHRASGRYQLGIISQVVDPPDSLRDAAQELAETDRPELARRDGAPRSGRCGARSSSASPTRAAPARSELVDMWGHPDQEEGPLAFAEKRDADWLPLESRARDELLDVRHLIVERHGPGRLVDQQPARPAQRDERARCATSSPIAWKELDADPEVRVIVHTGDGRAFQTGVDVTEIATDGVRAFSATATRWRTSTSTSPRGTSTCGSR